MDVWCRRCVAGLVLLPDSHLQFYLVFASGGLSRAYRSQRINPCFPISIPFGFHAYTPRAQNPCMHHTTVVQWDKLVHGPGFLARMRGLRTGTPSCGQEKMIRHRVLKLVLYESTQWYRNTKTSRRRRKWKCNSEGAKCRRAHFTTNRLQTHVWYQNTLDLLSHWTLPPDISPVYYQNTIDHFVRIFWLIFSNQPHIISCIQSTRISINQSCGSYAIPATRLWRERHLDPSDPSNRIISRVLGFSDTSFLSERWVDRLVSVRHNLSTKKRNIGSGSHGITLKNN